MPNELIPTKSAVLIQFRWALYITTLLKWLVCDVWLIKISGNLFFLNFKLCSYIIIGTNDFFDLSGEVIIPCEHFWTDTTRYLIHRVTWHVYMCYNLRILIYILSHALQSTGKHMIIYFEIQIDEYWIQDDFTKQEVRLNPLAVQRIKYKLYSSL